MRHLTSLACVCAVLLAVAACGGPSAPQRASSPAARPSASAMAARPTATAGTAATAPAGGASVEVTGIVGAVNTGTRLIEIDRLSGADVRRIEVGAGAVLRKAAGGATTLGQIRTSDRIVARGTLNERGDTLIASEITVQSVVPGAQPGG